jgi:hypothetical protein
MIETMQEPVPLAILLTTAEAHGQLWALFVQHADGRVELHKTDTYKAEIHPETIESARAETEDPFSLVSKAPVSCLEALEAEVELLSARPVCRVIYDTS